MDVRCLVFIFSLVAPSLSAPELSDNVYLSATDENGEATNTMTRNTMMTLNCAYNVDPLYLNFYNGIDQNIIAINFITGDHRVGAGFENIVSNLITGDGFVSINFKVPNNYKDNIIKCSVLDQAANKHEHERYFKIEDKVSLSATDENGQATNTMTPNRMMTLNCTYTIDPIYLNFYNGIDKNIFVVNFMTGKHQIGPGFENIVFGPKIEDGYVSIKFQVPYIYKDNIIKCTVLDQAANQHEDKKHFEIRVPEKVYLGATDEYGYLTDVMKLNTTMTLNCSYIIDPLYLLFHNGTEKSIFVVNFMTGNHESGAGFENIVSDPIIGDGLVSINFSVPYIYKDNIIKCSVLDQAANKHEHKRHFEIPEIPE